MAFPSTPSALWIVSLLTALLGAAVHSNVVHSLSDDDPLQPTTKDETVAVGGTVTLTCQVAETDDSSLQWSNTAQQTLYFGEKRGLRDNRIQLHRSTPTELSVTIAEVQLSDEGEYTCSIFTMPVRMARATVTVLGVPSKPQISGFEDPVREGETVTLTCTSTGSKPPASLRWYRGEEELQGGPDVVESVPDSPTYNVSSELTLKLSRDDNDALITCAVNHESLKPQDKRTDQALRVLYSPSAEIKPESDLPREGEKFYLRCSGNSNPEPSTYIWQKKDGELPPLAKIDDAYLRFESLNKSDNGVYLCQADNGIGDSTAEYTLLVQDPADPDSFVTSPPTPTSSPTPDISDSSPSPAASTDAPATTTISNELFPDLSFAPDSSATSSPTPPPLTASVDTAHPASSFAPSMAASSFAPSHPAFTLTPSVTVGLNGVHTVTDPTAMSTGSGVDHAVIGGVVAVIVFILLCLLIVLGRYLIRHKGTYLTHEAKGSDDAPDADTAIINAEGGQSGSEDKKEYFI